MIPLGCVTGRFQPVHIQHLALFEIALSECEHAIVAITNPDIQARRPEPAAPHRHTSAANPFTYFERARLLATALRARGFDERTTIVPFDMTRAEVWPQYVPLSVRQYVRAYSDWERRKAHLLEQAGYRVRLLQGDPAAKLASSDIRAAMRSGERHWQSLVADATVGVLEEFLDDVPMRERG